MKTKMALLALAITMTGCSAADLQAFADFTDALDQAITPTLQSQTNQYNQMASQLNSLNASNSSSSWSQPRRKPTTAYSAGNVIYFSDGSVWFVH